MEMIMEEKIYSADEHYKEVIKPKQLIEIEIAKLLGLNVLGWADCCAADEGLIYAQEEHERGDWCLSPVYLGCCVCELFDKIPDTFHKVPKFLGHSGSCMEEVPRYARDLDSTMLIINTLDNIFIKKDHITEKCFEVVIKKEKESYIGYDESLPLAICQAFLRYHNGPK
jgi:hypothetical protein